MTNPPTAEQLAMARRIAREASDQHGLAMTYAVAQTAALAAIIETTEAAARFADQIESVENGRAWDKRQAGRDDNFNCARASAANAFAAALRNNDHLKGQTHD